jgi:hypothetical protein
MQNFVIALALLARRPENTCAMCHDPIVRRTNWHPSKYGTLFVTCSASCRVALQLVVSPAERGLYAAAARFAEAGFSTTPSR